MEEWWGVEVAAMWGGNTEGEEREISVEMVEVMVAVAGRGVF